MTDATEPTYTCALCKGTFTYAWTEEEAEAEYATLFPAEANASAPRDILCDDCFKLVTASAPAERPEQDTTYHAGFREITPNVHVSANEIVVLGDPSSSEDENSPDYHNCDAMGCGSVGPHVVYRSSVFVNAARVAELESELSRLRASLDSERRDGNRIYAIDLLGRMLWGTLDSTQQRGVAEEVGVSVNRSFDTCVDAITASRSTKEAQ